MNATHAQFTAKAKAKPVTLVAMDPKAVKRDKMKIAAIAGGIGILLGAYTALYAWNDAVKTCVDRAENSFQNSRQDFADIIEYRASTQRCVSKF